MKKHRKEGMLKQTFKRLLKDKAAVIGLAGVALLVLLAIFAPYITKYSPDEMDFLNMDSPPSLEHIMGTDSVGRDYFTRLLYGGRYSLGLGILSSFLSMVIGIFFGSISGYFGKKVDEVIMRICDIIQSIPAMMVSMIVAISLGTGYITAIFALALGGCAFSTRLTRAQVLSVRNLEYLDAAKTFNCSSARIMFRHILPNVMSPMLLDFTMKIAQMIQISAGLSVIGLGVQPPIPEWGAMLSAGRNLIMSQPYVVLFPGLFIFAISFFINLFGDGLRDALDPKLKR